MQLPYEIFVGLRYLRAKRRQRTISLNTVVSIAGITLGVAALIGTLGIMTGFKEDLQAKILGTTSHIVVHDRTRENMTQYEEVVSRVEQVPHVLAATPFVFRQVLLTSPSAVQGIILRGIDPHTERRVTELEKNIKAGSLNDLAASPPVSQSGATDPSETVEKEYPGLILGKELSLRLGAFVGDQVNVVSPVGSSNAIGAIGMTPKIRTFRVVAIFESGMYEYDASLAYMAIGEAQKFFNMGNTVTGIEVKVDDIFQAAGIAQGIEGQPFAAGPAHGAVGVLQENSQQGLP